MDCRRNGKRQLDKAFGSTERMVRRNAVHALPAHRCRNVREQSSQFNGSAAKKILLQAAIFQINGNVYLIDLSRNRYLIPKGSASLSVQVGAGG
jgi:hypothetical protein